mgnify:CR=1 FL=1
MNDLRERLRVRLLPGLGVFLWLTAGYFSLQYVNFREVWWLQTGWEDRWVSIRPMATWPYLSYFVMVPLAGLTVRDKDYLLFIRSAFWIATVSFLFFAFLPTAIDRAVLEGFEMPAAYHFFISFDQPRNAFPSLHVSLATLSAFFWLRVSPLVGLGGVLWALAICWSAMSLRQHVIPDVIGGVFLAVTASWWSVRRLSEKA